MQKNNQNKGVDNLQKPMEQRKNKEKGWDEKHLHNNEKKVQKEWFFENKQFKN